MRMQDSLLAADRALPGRIGYLQNHYERFRFWSTTFPRLDLARQEVAVDETMRQEKIFLLETESQFSELSE